MGVPWLHVVGIGEDGLDGLPGAIAGLVRSAEVIVGGSRHHRLTDGIAAERMSWPKPFSALFPELEAQKGRRVVVLVTGDPFWFSAGVNIARSLGPGEVVIHPHVSAFQLAASRMGWPMETVQTLTVHGRPLERVARYLAPDARLLMLSGDKSSPPELASALCDRGYGRSRITVLAHMGGADEARLEGAAEDWSHRVPDFHTIAVECVADPGARILPVGPGLPDDAFSHDGNFTKQEVRAATVARLAPGPGALLWDVGLGCGSVAIEWIRSAPRARAVGIEPRTDRRSIAAANALALGAPELEIVEGEAPQALAGLDAPDAIFIGGGLSAATFDACWSALKPQGRLVVNAVSLESERLVLALAERHGGELSRISVERGATIGSRHVWKPQIAVVQWSLQK